MVLPPSSAKLEPKDKLFKTEKRRKFALRLFCVFLILGCYAWIFFRATSLSLPSKDNPLIFYSNQSRQDIKLLFCSALKKAESSLHMSVYGITDKEIIHLIKDRSLKGVQTVVTYDKHASSSLASKLPPTLTSYVGGSSGLMHRKILILDKSVVLLGSANLTTTSLKFHDNLVVGILSPDLAHYLISLQKPPERKRKRKTKIPTKEKSFPFTVGKTHGFLYLLPEHAQECKNALLTAIQEAKKTIQIAMFTFTHPEITEALILAKKRGVSVEAVIDYYTARGASHKILLRMQQENIPLRVSKGQQLLHHKWALIDGKTLLMGSANWTKAAFEKNEDFILWFPELSAKDQTFMHSLWKKIHTEAFDLSD